MNTGPLGQTRSTAGVILGSIVTLGIYFLFWIYKSYDEVRRHTGQGLGGGGGLLLTILLAPVSLFVLPSQVGAMYRRDGQIPPVSGLTGFVILIPFIGAIAWVAKVNGALNRYWEGKQRLGAPAMAPAAVGTPPPPAAPVAVGGRDPRFSQTDAEFASLKQREQSGQITAQQVRDRLYQLSFAAGGQQWTKDPVSGSWLVWNGAVWVEGNPPG